MATTSSPRPTDRRSSEGPASHAALPIAPTEAPSEDETAGPSLAATQPQGTPQLSQVTAAAKAYLQQYTAAGPAARPRLIAQGKRLLQQLQALTTQQAAAWQQAEALFLTDHDLSEEGQQHLLAHTLPQQQQHLAYLRQLTSTLAATLSAPQAACQAPTTPLEAPMAPTSAPAPVSPSPTGNPFSQLFNQAGNFLQQRFDSTWRTKQFIAAHAQKLPPTTSDQFNQTIAPLLLEKLPQEAQELQKEIIHYFKNNGSFYPVILQNFPAAAWVRESLLLDLTYPALLHNHTLTLQQFQAHWATATKQYKAPEITTLLRTLSAHQKKHHLALLDLCEVLAFLPPSPQQALQLLSQEDGLPACKQAWLTPRLQALPWAPAALRQLTQNLAQRNWNAARLNQLITGIQAEKDFSTLQAFLNMVDAHPLAEATLQEVFDQPPQAGTSPVQAWTHYLSCALLKTQLAQQFPTHATSLARATRSPARGPPAPMKP